MRWMSLATTSVLSHHVDVFEPRRDLPLVGVVVVHASATEGARMTENDFAGEGERPLGGGAVGIDGSTAIGAAELVEIGFHAREGCEACAMLRGGA